MKITIETDSRYDVEPNFDNFNQIVLSIGGVCKPFKLVMATSVICATTPYTPSYREATYVLEEINFLQVETQEQLAAKKAIEEAEAVVKQAEKSLQYAKEVHLKMLKNTGAKG